MFTMFSLLIIVILSVTLNIISIFRCFSFVGKNLPLSLHYAIGNFILQASKKNKIILNGPKDTFRSYLHVSDFCEWITIVGLSKNKNKI